MHSVLLGVDEQAEFMGASERVLQQVRLDGEEAVAGPDSLKAAIGLPSPRSLRPVPPRSRRSPLP